MVVSTAEFMFNVEYVAGVRYVIADFGSKKIILDLSEWDELNKDDPLATIVFFFFFMLSQIYLSFHTRISLKRNLARLTDMYSLYNLYNPHATWTYYNIDTKIMDTQL